MCKIEGRAKDRRSGAVGDRGGERERESALEWHNQPIPIQN